MKFLRTLLSTLALPALLATSAIPAWALDDLYITEFMAENDNTLDDEDGDSSDWIEIFNGGTNTVNLSGWYLTDSASNPSWRFPATNLAPNDFIIVFASGKDRRQPGAPLHTDFRLNDTGEFLGLIKPDGVTVQSSYSPRYPLQVPDISYGIPVVLNDSVLLATGAAGRFTVPLNDSLGLTWTLVDFNDASWGSVNNGVGFEADGGAESVVADSVADWSESGVQGFRNWTYGYFNATTGGVYAASKFIPFPNGTGPHSSGNFWNGESWKWFDGEPPFDMIGQIETRPSRFPTGGVKGEEHRVIRRWTSEVSGTLRIDWHLSKLDLTGGGVSFFIYQNGTQRDTFNLTGSDGAGVNRTTTVSSVQVGDIIDFVVAPGPDVIGDLVKFTASIRGTGTLAGEFASNVGDVMTNINASAYLRLPFNVTDVSAISGLTLRMKYDDGFVAYLNGTQVAIVNAPEPIEWNSAATGAQVDTDASQFQDFSLSGVKDLLVNGNNVLAIHGLNASATDGDFLQAAELIATRASLDVAGKRYFAGTTPGSVNGPGTTTIGPLITRIRHEPAEPADAEDLFVTSRISPTLFAIGSVTMYYRVMYGTEFSVPMMDDGLNGDGVAGDGIYGAKVPQSTYTQGEMIRYYIIATDSSNNSSRQPPAADTRSSSIYFGTVAQDTSLTNPLPVLHWFLPASAGAILNSGGAAQRATLYWKGELYDNVTMDRHGQSSTGFRKKSYNVDFNPDHHFLWKDGEDRVDDINWLNTYPDKSHMRNMLSYGIHEDAGPTSPSHFVVPVRVQSNAIFYGTAHIVENGDDNYLKRIGRDPNGALYKMYDTMSSTSTAEKKTRRHEDRSDLQELISRSATSNSTNRNWIYDNVDVSQTINFLAAMIVTANRDCCHKNYYVYRDTEGDGEWEMLPWDVDLSFGRNWQSGETYWDDRVYPNNGLFVGGNATLPTALFANSSTMRAMYLRRVRSIQEDLLQPNGTPYNELNFERQIDHWAALMTPDALMDLEKWGTWGGGQQNLLPGSATYNTYVRTLPESVSELKTNYLPARRTYVFDQKMGLPSEFPDAQPTNAIANFGTLDYNPASGNQDEEYLQIINPNNYALDISGWKLSGAVEHTFQGGVVIPRAGSSNILYVVANKKAFRNRAVSPRGGQGLYVEGPYKGQLSARGETIVLSDTKGRIVQTNLYQGNPSAPQEYLRITEIMYHPPAPPAGSPYEGEEFEYIELRNTGPANISLAGVRFTAGVSFDFTGSSVTSLAPGAYVLVVRNLAAFTSRYGANPNIAGQYTGILDNGGENLRLDDSVGEKILDFKYNNSWYPITDGPGASLVIVSDNADWRSWDLKTGWRPSAVDFGSPGETDPAPAPPAVPVVVNEILTHTDLPQVDAIELHNPASEVADISGWFLSDDFASPKKFRIPDGTSIPAGGYILFDETSFNTGATAFSLSSLGDEVYVFSGDGTNLTGYLQGYEFGAAENGVSFGRYINSQTNVHFVAQSALTLGSANAAPKVGPVVISEINYRPVEPSLGVDNEIDEYIEIANVTGAPVALFDPANPANTWRLRSAVDFDLPPNITLPVGGHAVIVSFNPAEPAKLATFQARYSVGPGVTVLGPWSGQLGNSGESVRLYRPDAPDAGEVPYILVDRVDYQSQVPWPSAADGIGPSLQKLTETTYGNDPVNWTAVGPSAGLAYVSGGTIPTVTRQPVSITGVAGRTATFSVEVTGTAPFFYQWRYNGISIGGANTAELNLVNTQPNQSGIYSVVVFNSAGSVESAGAQLNVVLPPSIVEHPVSSAVYIKPDSRAANLPNGTNVTFTVAATSGNSAMTYQWRFNGVDIPGATSPSYTVMNVQLENEGDYTCVVTDIIDSVESAPARLTPWLQPVITLRPVDQSVTSGGKVTMSVGVTGNPLPIAYSWRRNIGSIIVATNSGDYRTNIVTLNTEDANLTLADGMASTNYVMRIVVYNDANNRPGVTTTFTITVLADSDRDGIADVAELAFGLNPNNPDDAAGDLDNDGMSNRAEAIAGTSPTNALSYLKMEQSVAPGAATLQFGSVANRTYTIQHTDDINAATWNRLADFPALTTNGVHQIPDPNWTTNRFYRVATPALP